MSIIFGMRLPVGRVVECEQMLQLAKATEQYALDGCNVRCEGRIGTGFQPFHTHERSGQEEQPAADGYGNLLTFDGRLDNYGALCQRLSLEHDASDSAIVLAAFLRWNEGCFSEFVGDWALALWCGKDQLLYLARDHAGARTLYFEVHNGSVQWATYLETFFVNRTNRVLDAEFATAYLETSPLGDLTPYKGIRAVSPAHYLVVSEDSVSRRMHWNSASANRIRYKSDSEYEEHFRVLFSQAVERRTGPSAPILAHLSGGIDSTSIVCMSDQIRRSRGAESADLIDTVSLYSNSEPNWNERPFFSLVESRREKAGIHVETAITHRTLEPFDLSEAMYLWPGADSSTLDQEREFQNRIRERGYRVMVSGIGGDEMLGGVPTPLPELADHLVSGEIATFMRSALGWSLAGRAPFIGLAYETVKFTAELYLGRRRDPNCVVPWLRCSTRKLKNRTENTTSLRKLLPSVINSSNVWSSTLSTLPTQFPAAGVRYEYRYPYMDRDLVEFLIRIPREQLVRPGQRRSLMRRALRGIVPEEILQRKRKAYISRGPLVLVRDAQSKVDELCHASLSADLGIIDQDKLRAALKSDDKAFDSNLAMPLMRLLEFELWLNAHTVRDGPIRLSSVQTT